LKKSPSISENEIIFIETPIPITTNGHHHHLLTKDDKRKSWKELTKRKSEVNTQKPLSQSKRTKSDLQVPLLQTSNRKILTETDRTKSDLQVPVVVSPTTAKEQTKPQKNTGI